MDTFIYPRGHSKDEHCFVLFSFVFVSSSSKSFEMYNGCWVWFCINLLLQEAGIASFMYLVVVGIPPKTFSWKLACPRNRLVHVNNTCSIWSMAIISSLPSFSCPVITFSFSISSLNEVFIAAREKKNRLFLK